MSNLDPKSLVAIQGKQYCTQCGCHLVERPSFLPEEFQPEYYVSLNSAELTSVGWRVSGKGKIYSNVYCPACGAIMTIVAKEIPIESKTLLCPNCKKSEFWEYKINQITRTDKANEFEFQAELICKECKRRQLFKRLLSSVFDIVKIEVGPTGITFGKG